jgi:hypothetical protein
VPSTAATPSHAAGADPMHTPEARSHRWTRKEILDELRQPVKDLRPHIPTVFEGYGELNTPVLSVAALEEHRQFRLASVVMIPPWSGGRQRRVRALAA